MDTQHKAEISVEMDIADFSGKTVNRIDIQNMVGRLDARKSGAAIVISFIDGSTGTILISAGEEAHVTVAPYKRARMGDYTVAPEDSAVQVS